MNENSTESSEKIKVNGIEIYYKRIGNGPQTLLLLPGILGTNEDLKPLVEYLDRRKYTIIAWDPPGCGRSRPPDIDLSPGYLHREADYVISLMEALRVDKYSLLGMCQGGCTALVVASRTAAADRVQKLVVWSCNIFVTDKDVQYYETTRDLRNWPETRRRPMIERYGEKYSMDCWNSWVDLQRAALRDRCGDIICREELSKISAPTLVLHGDEDRLIPTKHAVYLHENIKDSTLKIFPNGKHLLHFMPDDSFNTTVDQFLTNNYNNQYVLHTS